ncbi:hypothetical protein BJ944DRAFT_239839 [Cunninghamella echinulata]|nr:hypothetical protein BJ944DRAFT_239839 [Cunninghamella echinulata]
MSIEKNQSILDSKETGHNVIDITSFADGKLSIEQQIEVHVHDLFDIKENKSISLDEVLEGLRYVMEFRIKGGYHPYLDETLMNRLCEGLLLYTGHTEGHLLRKHPTTAADAAFFLFGDFLEEVEEFRTAVNNRDTFELRNHLKIHHRCRSYSTEEQKRGAIAMIQLLKSFTNNTDWRDLVKESEHGDMETLLKTPLAADIEKQTNSKMPPPQYHPKLHLPPPPRLYFDRSVEKILAMYSYTDKEKGLSEKMVPSLREHYGINRLPDPPKPSAMRMLWTQLTDFIVLILLAAAIIQAGQKEFNSMAVLLIVVVLNTIIGFSQEWKASKTLNALMNLSVPQARVIRDGELQLVDSQLLVPGDLVVLEDGCAVPADLRLIEVNQLELVESILTGESLPVAKSIHPIKAKSRRIPLGDCKGNAFMSTTVARGRAKAIVVRTGVQTEIGKISSAIQAGSKKKTKTPVQKKLDKLGKYLVLIAILLCVLVVVIGIAWKKDAVTMVNVGLSLAVSVIPEGLVAVTTVTMALGVRRMAANQCIVRTLPSVESLGSVTVICSDKTGTLTEGKMGVAEIWTGDDTYYRFSESTSMDPNQGEITKETTEYRKEMMQSATLTESKNNSQADIQALQLEPLDTNSKEQYTSHLKYTFMISSLCNNSSVTMDEETKEWVTVGDPTEIALTVASQKGKLDKRYWEEQEKMIKVHERSFDSERKLMSVIYKQATTPILSSPSLDNLPSTSSPSTSIAIKNKKENEGKDELLDYWVLCKGAPEKILAKCTTYLVPSITHHDLSPTFTSINDEFIEQVLKQGSSMASQGLRVLCLAFKKVKVSSKQIEEEGIEKIPSLFENDFGFVALTGLMDPPKMGVQEAVATCQEAGIRVMMITGDHIDTATAIAEKLGIFQKNVQGLNRAILGRELDLLSEDALIELDPFPNVFARVSPDNKLTIVKALQKRGEIVAMTGDGVNDAPAIKSADVGVAMGIAGTEITKQAADIVLVNDNFATIVKAVSEGRHVFDNILKFIVYLLSCNGAEIFLMLICAMANLETPLTVMMILWANIISDIPPSMAIGVEPKEAGIMKRSPRPPTRGVLTKVSWLIIFCQALTIASLTIATYCISLFYLKHSLEDARSVAFATITMMQLSNSFTARSVQASMFTMGITGNKWLIGAFFVSFGFMLLGLYSPGISHWLELTAVDGPSWVMVIICVIIMFSLIEFEKMLIRKLNGAI